MESEPHVVRARRPDVLGVHSLDHFSFAVPDLAQARAFYEAFGLEVHNSPIGLELRTAGDPHIWAVITRGPRKRIGHLSFGAFEEDMEGLAARLAAAGVGREAPPEGFTHEGMWFRDPHGLRMQIKAAPKLPNQRVTEESAPRLSSHRRAQTRDEVKQVCPKRLAHVLMFTPDIDRSIAFSRELLGLGLSDHPGPVAFMHGRHGSDHHLIAFAQSPVGIGYHHSAWEVSSLDDVGLGAMQMTNAGFKGGWGLGRHVLGSNYFPYVRDPWGSYAEYSFDMDYVPANLDWPTGYPSPDNSLFLWGPDVPYDFVTNHERG